MFLYVILMLTFPGEFMGSIQVTHAFHYSDVMNSTMAPQITSVSIICSAVCSGADQRKHQSVIGLCDGNSPVTGEFPAQSASNAENFAIWWRHHDDLFTGIGANLRLCTTKNERLLGSILPLFLTASSLDRAGFSDSSVIPYNLENRWVSFLRIDI